MILRLSIELTRVRAADVVQLLGVRIQRGPERAGVSVKTCQRQSIGLLTNMVSSCETSFGRLSSEESGM